MRKDRLALAVAVLLAAGCAPWRALPSSAATALRFQSPVSIAAGAGPVAVAVADVNRDGVNDLVVVDRSSNSVGVLLVRRGGGFMPMTSYAAGSAPVAVAAADLNHDGYPDLVVADNGESAVSVLVNAGNGTFRAPVRYSVPAGPQAVAVGDLTGDGVPDLVVATGNNASTGAAGTVCVLVGRGDGSFLPPMVSRAGTNPRAVAIAPLDPGRGSLLLVANYDASNSLSALRGLGRPGMTAPEAYPVGAGPIALALGDFNGDGKVDAAVADEGAGTVSILLGSGNGRFSQAASFPAGYNPESIASADLNGDGRLDLVTADPYGQVHVLLGNGDGTFQAPISFLANQLRARSTQQSVAVGDLNGDGRPDLVVTDLSDGVLGVLMNSASD